MPFVVVYFHIANAGPEDSRAHFGYKNLKKWTSGKYWSFDCSATQTGLIPRSMLFLHEHRQQHGVHIQCVWSVCSLIISEVGNAILSLELLGQRAGGGEGEPWRALAVRYPVWFVCLKDWIYFGIKWVDLTNARRMKLSWFVLGVSKYPPRRKHPWNKRQRQRKPF